MGPILSTAATNLKPAVVTAAISAVAALLAACEPAWGSPADEARQAAVAADFGDIAERTAQAARVVVPVGARLHRVTPPRDTLRMRPMQDVPMEHKDIEPWWTMRDGLQRSFGYDEHKLLGYVESPNGTNRGRFGRVCGIFDSA